MNNDALIPIEQKEIDFYGDAVTAVLLEDGTVYIPIKPICDLIGVNWDAQRRRIDRDPILSEMSMSTAVTTADIDGSTRRPKTSYMIALPLDYLNGWLFGINSSRVKPEIKDALLRYQRECYRVLYEAFNRTITTDAQSELMSIRNMGLAIARMAEQQMEMESRLMTTESRLDKAAIVVRGISQRVNEIEHRLAPENAITDEQAADVSQKVKAVAHALSEHDPSKNHFQSIFGEIHRRYRVTGYKTIRQDQYQNVLGFLDEWLDKVRDQPPA